MKDRRGRDTSRSPFGRIGAGAAAANALPASRYAALTGLSPDAALSRPGGCGTDGRIRLSTAVSLLAHLLCLALLLVSIRHRASPPELLPPPAPVTMVFEGGRKSGPTLPNPSLQTPPSQPGSPDTPAETVPQQPPLPSTALQAAPVPQPPVPETPLQPNPAPPPAFETPPSPPASSPAPETSSPAVTPAPSPPAETPPPAPPSQAPPSQALETPPQAGPSPPSPQTPPPAMPAAPTPAPAPLEAAPALHPPSTVPPPSTAPLPPVAAAPQPPDAARTPAAKPSTAAPPSPAAPLSETPPAQPRSRPSIAAAKPFNLPPPILHAPPAKPAPNPFASAMDFNLGRPIRPVPRPQAARRPRGVIDMSLGPAAKGPSDITPYGDRENGPQGADWRNALSRWVAEHAFYPDEARREMQEGDAKVHVVVQPSGRVTAVELVGRSGSVWLDMALVALFRGAQIPPLPSGEREPLDFNFTMRYVIERIQ